MRSKHQMYYWINCGDGYQLTRLGKASRFSNMPSRSRSLGLTEKPVLLSKLLAKLYSRLQLPNYDIVRRLNLNVYLKMLGRTD
jgi:hypothetical protein